MNDRVQDYKKKAEIFSAALVIIGNEILAGRTQDTNTQWIATHLTEHGIVLTEVRTIPDERERIMATVKDLRGDFDYVFTTGGIGPTHDDITAECVAEAFGKELVRNDEAFRMLEEHYGLEELTPPRAKMCMIPVDATLIPNPVTAAPGFRIENVFVMAGVPRIMHAMLDHILGTIDAGAPILSNTVACSLTESAIASDLSALQDEYPEIMMGSYPHYRGGVLGLSLVLRGTAPESLQEATDKLIQIIEDHGDEPRALSIRSS